MSICSMDDQTLASVIMQDTFGQYICVTQSCNVYMAFFKLGTSPSYTLTAFVCDAIEKASYSKEKRTSIYTY